MKVLIRFISLWNRTESDYVQPYCTPTYKMIIVIFEQVFWLSQLEWKTKPKSVKFRVNGFYFLHYTFLIFLGISHFYILFFTLWLTLHWFYPKKRLLLKNSPSFGLARSHICLFWQSKRPPPKYEINRTLNGQPHTCNLWKKAGGGGVEQL